ncbi:MAG: PD40 domain-containing protein [Myxococcales bacterium]|nr:PD40 domain-containing protein [Myxococcales bacterium]
MNRNAVITLIFLGPVLLSCANDARTSQSRSPTDGGDDRDSQGAEGGGSHLPAPSMFFAAKRGGSNLEIWRASLDMSDATPVTDDARFSSWWPRSSPTDNLVYFYRTPSSSTLETNNYEEASLWKMKRDGTDAREVRPSGTDGWKAQGVIDFSPDGQRVVMAGMVPEGNQANWHLFVANADLSNLKKITTRGPLFLDPSWSPDGKRVVYVSIPEDQVITPEDLLDPLKVQSYFEIFTSKADGTDEQRVTYDSIRDHDPYWSPDGREIVFESAVRPTTPPGLGTWALRAAPATGGEVRTVLDDGNINTVGRWTRDSRELYFHRLVFDPLQGWHIAKINRDGTDLVRVTPMGIDDDQEVDLFYPAP